MPDWFGNGLRPLLERDYRPYSAGEYIGMSSSTSDSGQSSVHGILVTICAEVIGVSLLAIIADASDALGKVAVALMAGWLLLFLMTNATDLSTWAAKL